MKEVWLPSALHDLQRLHGFIKNDNPHAALAALQAVRQTALTLLQFPKMGVQISADSPLREMHIPFGRRAYVMRYRLEEPDRLIVVRVWHSYESR